MKKVAKKEYNKIINELKNRFNKKYISVKTEYYLRGNVVIKIINKLENKAISMMFNLRHIGSLYSMEEFKMQINHKLKELTSDITM